MKRTVYAVCAILLVLAIGCFSFALVKRNQIQAEWPDGLYFIQGDATFESGESFQLACLAVGQKALEGLKQNTTKFSLIDTQGKSFPVEYSIAVTAPYPHFTVVTMNFSMDAAIPEAEFNCIEIAEKGRKEKQLQKLGTICAKSIEFDENALLFESSMYPWSSSDYEEITYSAWNNTGTDLILTGIDMLSGNPAMLKAIRVGVRSDAQLDDVVLQELGNGVAIGPEEGILITVTYDFSSMTDPYFLYDTPQISYMQKAENGWKKGLSVPNSSIANAGLCNLSKLIEADESMTAVKQYIHESREP